MRTPKHLSPLRSAIVDLVVDELLAAHREGLDDIEAGFRVDDAYPGLPDGAFQEALRRLHQEHGDELAEARWATAEALWGDRAERAARTRKMRSAKAKPASSSKTSFAADDETPF